MANPTYTRNNAWNNGGTFDNKDLYWYAKGVAQMMARPIADPQSWWFYAAIHGEYANPDTAWYQEYANGGQIPAWQALLAPPTFKTTPLPTPDLMKQYWDQCQHGSWYFAPWHRGYLLSIEAQLRLDIIAQGGPADWALPYWDYFGDNGKQFVMPPALGDRMMPDNTTPNPLYITMRYGPNGDSNIFVPTPASKDPNELPGGLVTDTSLNDTVYSYVGSQTLPGFGGFASGFSHSGNDHGDLESNPHDLVHYYVGGPSTYGLMGDPNTAALDPVFYLHHCNIDRMWASWNAAGNQNPTDAAWLDGPTPQFVMPVSATGQLNQPWIYTPGEMNSLDSLDYQYQELTAIPVSQSSLAKRLLKLGAAPQALAAFEAVPGIPQAPPQEPKTTATELMGASTQQLVVHSNSNGISTPVQLQKSVQQESAARLKSFTDFAVNADAKSLAKPQQPALPDKIFLKLEHITGRFDATAFNVYVKPKESKTDAPAAAGALPTATNAGVLAGTVALFGLRLASLADSKHGGGGLTFTLNITPIVDQLHLENNFTSSELTVSLIPDRPLPQGEEVQIGRISIYRQAF
jgi:tyrosinase